MRKTFRIGSNQKHILTILHRREQKGKRGIKAKDVYRIFQRFHNGIEYFSIWRSLQLMKRNELVEIDNNFNYYLTELGISQCYDDLKKKGNLNV